MKFVLSALLFILCLPLCAQKSTTTKTTTTRSTTTPGDHREIGRHSEVATHNGKVDSYSTTNRTRTSLTFTSDFKAVKQSSLERLLLNRLSGSNPERDGEVYFWHRSSGGDSYFTCTLTDGELRLSLDRTVAPQSFYAEIDALCNDIVEIISAHKEHFHQPHTRQLRSVSKTTTTSTNAEAKLERALEELNTAREKVERLGKEVDKERRKN